MMINPLDPCPPTPSTITLELPPLPPLIDIDLAQRYKRDDPSLGSAPFFGLLPTQVDRTPLETDAKDFKALGSLVLAFVTGEYILSYTHAAPKKKFYAIKQCLISSDHLSHLSKSLNLVTFFSTSSFFSPEALPTIDGEDLFKTYLGILYQQKGLSVVQDWIQSVYKVSSGVEDDIKWRDEVLGSDYADVGTPGFEDLVGEEEGPEMIAEEEQKDAREAMAGRDVFEGPERPASLLGSGSSSGGNEGRNFASIMEEYRVHAHKTVTYAMEGDPKGPPHKPIFTFSLRVQGLSESFTGQGESKKSAKNEAARKAVEAIGARTLATFKVKGYEG